jgi:hypothetical protein
MSGFHPVRMRDGSPYNGAAQRCYYKTAADLYVGDPVTIKAAPDEGNGYLEVLKATAGSTFYGIVVGIEPIRGDLSKQYVPSGTESFVMVATDTNVVYRVQEDGDTDALELVDIGKNVDWIAGTAVALTGTSGAKIDSSSHGTSAALNFKLLGVADFPGNLELVDTASATSVVWLVTPNESIAAANSVGI